ncbi:MAG: hypothetical protein EKK48_10330 [Candidatus Melainabacteria bacterium]|nr:MAG: hypothetical protein EKK48_10330 [Candidatus Melainabacteria bacterium]
MNSYNKRIPIVFFERVNFFEVVDGREMNVSTTLMSLACAAGSDRLTLANLMRNSLIVLILIFAITGCTKQKHAPVRNQNNAQVAAYPVESGLLTRGSSPKSLKVLFIGNSILYWHNVPKIFADLTGAIDPQKRAKVAYVVGNNYSLKDHWDANAARKFIREFGPWDFVILQDQTNTEFSETAEENEYIEAFVKEVRSVHANPLLFQTYVDDDQWAEESKANYEDLARRDMVKLLPVGTIWNHLRISNRQSLKLYDLDGHHPSMQGSFLIALATLVATDRSISAAMFNRINYENIDLFSLRVISNAVLSFGR